MIRNIKSRNFTSLHNDLYISLQLTAIKDSLKVLEPGHFLALHGMPVAGKSVLAAEAVRDADITLQV